jgi:drug/metabolite transporter (DMT)-like permease
VRLVSATTDEGARLWGAAPTAYLLLLVAMLSWSANMVIGRGLVGVVGPFTLSWTRWTIAFLLVLPFAGRELWARRAVLRREWKLFLVLGVVGFAGSNTFCYLALQSTSAVNASLINSAGPLMIFAASLVVLGERFGARQLWGLALALAGVVAIVLRGDPRTLFALEVNRGDLFMLMGVAAW